MPKTNLQTKSSYYEKIIAESKNSPLTPKYKGICDALEQLVKFSKKLNDPAVEMNETEFANLKSRYTATKNACNEYFNSNEKVTAFEKDRSSIMKSISRMLDRDMAVLNKCDPKQPGSLAEIISRSRSHTMVLSGNDIQKIGGALNKRIPVKTPGGMKGFFTPTTIYNQDKKWQETLEKHIADHMEELNRYPQINKEKLEKLKTDEDLIHNFCIRCPGRPFNEYLKLVPNKAGAHKQVHAVAHVLGIGKDLEDAGKILEEDKNGLKKAVINIIDSMALLANTHGIMSASGIKKNANISHRNCAMSDMADLLGCNNLVAKSVPMKIKIGNEEVEGVFMETVEGTDLNSIKEDDPILNARGYSFNSPEALMQLSDLQVLDYICCNTDRHTANMIYQFGKDGQGQIMLKGIKGIDNDCSFGEIRPRNRILMNLVSPEKMDCMTPAMAIKVASLTENDINMRLADSKLSEREKLGVWVRTQEVQKALELGKIIPRGKDYWQKNPIQNVKTTSGNYIDRIKNAATRYMNGYIREKGDEYKEILYMRDRRESNKVLLERAEKIAVFREKMDKAKATFFNSSEYNLMKKYFEQVETYSKAIKQYKGRPNEIPNAIAAKLETAYEQLADKTFKYVSLKKLVPATGNGVLRREFAQELMEFADDTLQEMTKNPELKSETEKNQSPEMEEPDNSL